MALATHTLFIEHTLVILLLMIGCLFAAYVIASKICEAHRKTFYRIMCAFVIVSFILGVRSYYAMLILLACYYVTCALIYFRCNKKLEEDKKDDGETSDKA